MIRAVAPSLHIGRHWAWLAALAAGIAIHLPRLLGARPFVRDAHMLFVPVKAFIAQELKAGRLPQWWPWDAGGSPLLAQPLFSSFHPTTALYAVLPFWTAFSLQDLCGTLLGLSGAFALARALGQSRAAALAAALLYGGCGYFAGLSEFTFSKLAAGTLPWYAWSLLRPHGFGRKALLSSLSAGLLLLAGDPQIATLAAMVGAALALAHRRDARTWALIALGPPMGALLAAVQLLPAVLVAPETERALVMVEANKWSLRLADLAGMVMPLNSGAWAFVPSTYFGAAGLCLACASLPRSPRRPGLATLWALALFSLWLSLGDAYGLNKLARLVVPFWSQYRFPIKSSIVLFLCLSLLAGAGFHQLQNRRRRRRALLAALLGGGVALAPALAAYGRPPLSAGMAIAVAVVAAVILSARSRRAPLAAWLIGVEVIAAGQTGASLTDAAFYSRSPLARALEREGVGRWGPSFGRFDRSLRSPSEWPQADVAAAGAGSALSGLWGLTSFEPYLPGASVRIHRLFREKPEALLSKLAGTYSVGYLVMREPIPARLSDRVIERDPRFEYALVRLRHFLPRAYAVHRGRIARGSDEALQRVSAREFMPGREVVLEIGSDHGRAEWEVRADQPAVPARIAEGSQDSRIMVDAELPWDGFVVLNEAAFPGWSATVDGAPTDIMVANAAMRAVEVPAGRHRVEFAFETPGLRLGAALSGMAVLLLLLLELRTRRMVSLR
jgi:hypothetical protein